MFTGDLMSGNRFFDALVSFAMRRTRLYLGCCIAIGAGLRWLLCHGDLSRFFNPLAPFFA